MIDIKKEAEKIAVDGALESVRDLRSAADALKNAIIALCARVDAAAREEAARECDVVAVRLAAENLNEQGQDEAGGAKECATAIRATKGEVNNG